MINRTKVEVEEQKTWSCRALEEPGPDQASEDSMWRWVSKISEKDIKPFYILQKVIPLLGNGYRSSIRGLNVAVSVKYFIILKGLKHINMFQKVVLLLGNGSRPSISKRTQCGCVYQRFVNRITFREGYKTFQYVTQNYPSTGNGSRQSLDSSRG